MSTVQAPLPQAAGYGVVVGLGVTFALGKECFNLTLKHYG